MRIVFPMISWLAIGSLVLTASAADKKEAPAEKKAPAKKREPAKEFAPIEDVPNLPRVLLIGDSISIGYLFPTRKLLEGKANVHRPPVNCGPTIRGVESIDSWLGDKKWDVIHFNFGLHDVRFMDETGKQQVSIEDYEKNLRSLVERMKKTGAVVIFATTTPIVPDSTGPKRLVEDVLAYNKVALKVMEENGVNVDDLYAFALPQLADIQLPKNVHFSPAGSAKLAEAVAASIEASLPKK